VHSAIVENGLQRIFCLFVSHHHAVILTNSRRPGAHDPEDSMEEDPVVLSIEKAL